MKPPLVHGGQGREAEEISEQAMFSFISIVVYAIIYIAACIVL